MTRASKRTLWKGSMEMSRLAEIDPVTCGDSDKGLLVASKLPLYWEFIGMPSLQRRPIWRTSPGHNGTVCARLWKRPCFSFFVSRAPFDAHLLIQTQVCACVSTGSPWRICASRLPDCPQLSILQVEFYLTPFYWKKKSKAKKKQNKIRSYYGTKLLS